MQLGFNWFRNIVLCLCLLVVCYPSGVFGAEEGLKLQRLEDIQNKRIGVLLGSIHDAYAHKHFPGAGINQFHSISDMLFALKSKKVDVAFVGKVALKDILVKNPELAVLAADIYFVDIAAGFNSENDALREKFNRFLQEIRSNGIYKDMVTRWMDHDNIIMPVINGSQKNGILRVGIVSDIGLPFSTIREGQNIGFDIELSSRFAAWLGMAYEPIDMQFGSLIASISTNKLDIITSSMAVTPERAKKISFSEPYYASGATVIARKENIMINGQNLASTEIPANKQGFFMKLAGSFHNNLILEKRYLMILDGLKITLLISLLSALFGTLLGAIICYGRMSEMKWISNFARIFIDLVRGVPILVLLMCIYYIVFASSDVSPVFVSVIAFGLNFGAYAAEIFRSGISSIDKGQWESAIASGFTPKGAFRFIILPQAVRPILPVYKGEMISLIKMTSVVGYIAVQDLTKASDIIRSRTFDAFFPLLMAAVLYFTLAWLFTLALEYLEKSTKF
jgi:polar amino acid transport system substrate-binding protein